MAQFGSDRLSAAQSTNGIADVSGIPLISTFNDFGASPLGIAARSQALYGIANAQFNLLPEDVDAEIADYQNGLPYWSVSNYSGGRIVPKSFYDLTTSTWSVELDPTAGSAADYIEMKTRSYLLTDDNLALRQKAYLTMGKGTAYAGATQFNVTLTAEYFGVDGTSLSSYAIGTALDNTAMTSITGVTTSGSAAISAAASYVDFTIKLSVTATVTSGVKVYLKSFLIQTSSAATGSFLISETITSSQTWTAPTGVSNLVAVVVGGAGGGGGGGGGVRSALATPPRASGGGGGGGGAWAILRDVSLGTATSVSIGIGAGGSGGTAMNYTVTGAVLAGTVVGGVGAAGGATTFGSYISVPGGGGGGGGTGVGTASALTVATGGTAGPAGATATFTFFGGTAVLGGAGGVGGSATGSNNFDGSIGGTSTGLSFANYPYSSFSSGGSGGNGSWSGGDRGSANNGVAGGSAHFGGGGGGGASLFYTDSGSSGTNYTRIGTAGVGGAGGGGGGGGGAGARITGTSGTILITAGTGGNAGALSIAGGGGGGAALAHTGGSGSLSTTIKAGPGGTGSSGFVTVVFVS